MKLSSIVTAGFVGLAMAAPVEKRAYVTDVIVKYVYVTVTAGQPLPTKIPTKVDANVVGYVPGRRPAKASTKTSVVVVTPTPAPAPVVVPSSKVEVPKVETPAPAPAPAVEEPAPVVVVTPTPTPEKVETAPVTPVVGEAPVVAPAVGDYKGSVLYHHNVHRANHSAPDMTYSDTLASYALTVAKTCTWGHDLTPGGGGYGQNIAMTGTSQANEKAKSPADLVANTISNQWYNNEIMDFPTSDYGDASPSMTNFDKWGHASQVIWKSSTQVGCATYYCQNGTPMFKSGGSMPMSGWYTVCNYKSAGNMGGAYGTNVLPPLGKAVVKPAVPV